MKLKEKNPKLKILISCGGLRKEFNKLFIIKIFSGWGANGQFEGIVGSEEVRTTFSKNVIEFCRKWGFDGIDLGKLILFLIINFTRIIFFLFKQDWEFPGGNCFSNLKYIKVFSRIFLYIAHHKTNFGLLSQVI